MKIVACVVAMLSLVSLLRPTPKKEFKSLLCNQAPSSGSTLVHRIFQKVLSSDSQAGDDPSFQAILKFQGEFKFQHTNLKTKTTVTCRPG